MDDTKGKDKEITNDAAIRLQVLETRWSYIKDDPEGARALLLLLKLGKGAPHDFDTIVDRIIESRKIKDF